MPVSTCHDWPIQPGFQANTPERSGRVMSFRAGGVRKLLRSLQAGELFQNSPRCQSRRQGAQAMFQRDLQAVGDKRNDDMGIDTIVPLMVDRVDGKVLFDDP